MKNKVFIILEAGVNHDGKLSKALKLVDVAKSVGADAIKFQTWKTENLLIPNTKSTNYQFKFSKISNQYDLIKKLELRYEDFEKIFKYCKKKKITFLSTADDIESAKFLKDYQKIFKIGSGEIDNVPFLKYIGSLKKEVIISSGNSTVFDITKALKILIDSGTPKKKITLLHCNSAYPTPLEDANVNSVSFLKKKFKIKIGYSDHTLGFESAIAAVALGAKIVEKHFTLNKNTSGPDHHMSLNPSEARSFIKVIKNTSKSLGVLNKKITKSEKKNKIFVRKSIVAKLPIKKNEKFSNNNLTTKRPALGLSPSHWNQVVGKKSNKNYNINEFIKIRV